MILQFSDFGVSTELINSMANSFVGTRSYMSVCNIYVCVLYMLVYKNAGYTFDKFWHGTVNVNMRNQIYDRPNY